MMLDVSLVPPGLVHNAYPHIVTYLMKSVKWTQGTSDADDLSRAIFATTTQLWVVFDEKNFIRGYLATEIVQYPKAKHFTVLHCAGEDGCLEACVDRVFTLFEQYAREQGCDAVEIKGRNAWSRFVEKHGYESPMRHYFKRLT